MTRYGYRTDVGHRRDINEDALLLLPKHGVFAVADGVGGQNSGEVASRKAVQGIEAFIGANPLAPRTGIAGKYRDNWLAGYFARCLQRVNTDILKAASQDVACANMATTVVLCLVEGARLHIANVGDSRAYMLRDGALSQLTDDHTYVNELIQAGTLTKSEARIHPKKNIITRALGAAKGIEPDFYSFDFHEADRLLLCTDGLHGELTDEEIARLLREREDPGEACRALVAAANEKGGHDNISVVCIDNRQ